MLQRRSRTAVNSLNFRCQVLGKRFRLACIFGFTTLDFSDMPFGSIAQCELPFERLLRENGRIAR